METLQLKELAAYLPYGLKCQYEGIINGAEISAQRKQFAEENNPYPNWEHYKPIKPIEGLKIGYLKSIHAGKKHFTVKCGIKGLKVFYNARDLKPILYPLDYLTKPITHNGETFVPIIKLVDPNNNNNDWSKMEVKVYNPFPNIKMHRNYYKVTHNELGELLVINPKNILVLPYNIIQNLLEWRFDVFNLINRGLAIPITETFNPYK